MGSVPLDVAKIKSLRLARGWTMDEAARRSGLGTKQRWYELESGKRPNIGIQTLERVAAALGVKVSDLLK